MKTLLLVAALCLASCSDPEPRPVRIVRTEGARDMVNEQWKKIEERPQPNGDMWTLWMLSKPDEIEIRWEHRKGLMTRFVPRTEEAPK